MFFFLMIRIQARSTLVPYPTLFRSGTFGIEGVLRLNPGLLPWAGMSDAFGVTNVRAEVFRPRVCFLFSGQRPVSYQPRATPRLDSRFSSCRPAACFLMTVRLVQPFS